MFKVQKSELSTDKSDRRRGRPAGKNRKPLSLEERRARNALYERERRNETADALGQLAEAACCDPQISHAELLATVISQLRSAKRQSPKNIEELKRTNENLESQIADLQNRLGTDTTIEFDYDSNDSTLEQKSFDSSSNSGIEESIQKGFDSQKIVTEEILPDFENTTGKVQRSRKISKTSKSSSVSGAFEYESLSGSETDSDSECSYQSTKSKLRKKIASEQIDTATEFIYNSNILVAENEFGIKLESNQNDIEGPDDTLNALPEGEYLDTNDTTLMENLTKEDKQIINEWLDCNETLNTMADQENNKARTFLDFDSFLLDINV